MASPEPQPGDLIEIYRFCYSHWAVYVGDGYVVHVAPPSNIPGALVASIMSSLVEKAFVKKEQLRDVVGGDKYKVNNKHDDKYKPFKPSKIVQQAEKLVGKEFSYNMFSNNCEHFVNELRYGVPRSDQPEPQPGDLIEIYRFCYSHWAVYVGDGYVVHVAPPSNIPGALVASIMSSLVEKAFVKKEQLRDVVGGDKYKVNNKHDDKYKPFKPSKIVQQAEKLVGKEFSYNMFSNNCEHFVNELRYGVPRSDQPEPQPGDLIDIFCSFYRHCAVYDFDNGRMIHMTPSRKIPGADGASIMSSVVDKAFVKKERLCAVVGGDTHRVNNKHDDKYNRFPPRKTVQPPEELVEEVVDHLRRRLISNYHKHFINEQLYTVLRSD